MTTGLEFFKNGLLASLDVKKTTSQDEALLFRLSQACETIISSLRSKNQILFCGNGGSASDALHLAAELSGRFYYDRPPLNAEVLGANFSYLTAVANDYSYDEIFSRALTAKGRAGDVLVGLSTSGNSGNVLKAFGVAKSLGVKTIAFTGETGGKLKDLSDYLINVPSKDTARIQEVHIVLGHLLCERIEAELFP